MATQRQIDANRRNRAKRRGLTSEGRKRLREAALRNKPWEHSTGPHTEEGKRRSRENALFSGKYCRTIEPFASVDRLQRLLARRAYYHTRLAWLEHRLASSSGSLGEGGSSGSSHLEGALATGVYEHEPSGQLVYHRRLLAMLHEQAQVLAALEEDAPLRLQAWRAVLKVFGLQPVNARLPAAPATGCRNPDARSPDAGCSSESAEEDDLVVLNCLIQHVASRPVTLGSFALFNLFKRIVHFFAWPGVAASGYWERSCQLMVRRDE